MAAIPHKSHIFAPENLTNMSYEVRTGALALIAIALSLWGIKYIQGTNILSKSTTLYAYYDNVAGVEVGTPVQISGVTVGSVSARDLGVEDRRVRLTLTIERPMPLPKNATATLASTSMLGGMAILLDYDRPCTGADCAENGDVLQGRTLGMVEAILGGNGLTPYIDQVKSGIQGTVDTLNNTLLGENSAGPLAETFRDMSATMQNLKAATDRMNIMLQRSSPELEKTLANVSRLTTTLGNQTKNIEGIIANTNGLSQQMVDAKLGEAVAEAKAAIAELNSTLASAKTAMTGINSLVGKVEQGEGSLGRLMKDEALYDNLNALSFSMDSLIIDIQEKPYRYLPLKSRRRVQRYDALDQKD